MREKTCLQPLIIALALVLVSAASYAGERATPTVTTIPTYTDDPLVARTTVARWIHLTELRSAVNDIRLRAGLPAYVWTETVPGVARAVQLTELRSALGQALVILGRPVPTWTDTIVSKQTLLRARHLEEIREATKWDGWTSAGGTITTNTKWLAANSPYVVGSSVTVTNGATLTIEPGTVVKFAGGTDLQILEGASLIANGTPTQPVIFTSIKDDSVAGDTNGDGGATQPARGDWRTLAIGNPAAQNNQPAFGSMTNSIVRYGSQFVVRFSAPTLRDMTSTFMSGDGLYLEAPPPAAYVLDRLTLTDNDRNLNLIRVPASTTIRKSIIRRATTMALQAIQGTAALVEDNSIDYNKSGAAIVTDGTSPLVLRYNSITNNRTPEGYARGVRATSCCVNVDARYNWWGSTTGPEVEGQPNSGGGGQVDSNVQYDPWLGQEWAGAFKVGDHPWTLKAGVGVDVATGNFNLAARDLVISTVGFPLEIVRTYNNKAAGGTRSDFGDGWTWNYGTLLDTTHASPHGVVWYRDDGTQTYFKKNPDNTFSSEEGIYEKLVWQPGFGYRMTRKDQSVLVFGENGYLTTQIDPNSNATTIARDGAGRVIQVTEPLGRSLTMEYAGDYISKITDPLGRTFRYERNPNGAIASVLMRDQFGTLFGIANYYYGPGGRWEMTGFADADGNSLEQSFEPVTQRVAEQRFNSNAPVKFAYGPATAFGFSIPAGATAVQDGRKRVHDFRYTASNKVTDHYRQQLIDGGGSEWIHDAAWSYTSYLVSRYTRLNGVTESMYDWNTGNLSKLVEPGGRTTTYTYDLFNNRTSTTDHLGRVTRYEYDGNQRLVRETDALGRITQYEYDARGQLARTINPLNHVTTFYYDQFGYQLQQVNALNQVTRFTHDVLGRKLNETNPLGQQTSSNYDGRGNPRDVTDPLGNQTTYVYDIKGRKTEVRDAEGRVTRYEYNDAKNLLVKTTDALGGTVELTRDEVGGNITAVKDPRGNITTIAYDDQNRKISETDPLGRTWRYAYLRQDLLANVTDAQGARTVYLYDSSNRLVVISYPDQTQSSNTYDAVGNRIKLTDWTGETTWAYDALNRVVTCTKNGQTTGYSYDAIGNLVTLTYPGSKKVTYTYDELNRLKTVADWEGRVTSYTNYDAAGRLKIFTYPNGVIGFQDYDAAGRLNYLQYSRQNETLRAFTYEYDRIGNRTIRRSLLDGNIEESYSYDPLYRLSGAYYADNSKSVGYGYDAAGNRTSQQEGSGSGALFTTFTGTYDAADQLQSGNNWTRTYDENGAQIVDGPRVFSWNAQHLLSQVAYFDTTIFLYDGDGRRVRQTKAGVATDYVVETAGKLAEVLTESTFGGTTYYIYGHDLLYTIEPNGPHYLHGDAIGSTMVGTNGLGQDETRLAYDVFGAFRSLAGSHSTRRRFAGEESDDTGLIYLRARYYHPGTGRFISRDPFPLEVVKTQAANRYVYAQNSPATYVDPSGAYAVLDDLAFGAAGLLVAVGSQAVADVVLQREFDRRNYAAAAMGGFVGGVASLYLTPAIGGAIGGAISSSAGQYLKSGTISLSDVGVDATVGAVTGGIRGPRITGVTAGSNSFLAISKQTVTKLERNVIDGLSQRTAIKIGIARTIDASTGSLLESLLHDMISRLTKMLSTQN